MLTCRLRSFGCVSVVAITEHSHTFKDFILLYFNKCMWFILKSIINKHFSPNENGMNGDMETSLTPHVYYTVQLHKISTTND